MLLNSCQAFFFIFFWKEWEPLPKQPTTNSSSLPPVLLRSPPLFPLSDYSIPQFRKKSIGKNAQILARNLPNIIQTAQLGAKQPTPRRQKDLRFRRS